MHPNKKQKCQPPRSFYPSVAVVAVQASEVITLPTELLIRVLENLNVLSLQNAGLVNRGWRECVIVILRKIATTDITRGREPSFITCHNQVEHDKQILPIFDVCYVCIIIIR